MKFWRDCSGGNPHRLAESDLWYDVILWRWRPWRHFMQKTAATWWVNTKHLASTSSWSVVHSFVF